MSVTTDFLIGLALCYCMWARFGGTIEERRFVVKVILHMVLIDATLGVEEARSTRS